MDYEEVGTITLKPQHHALLNQFADTILEGSFEQAQGAFEIIFEREPENDFEMEVFKLLCEQKIKERDGDYGIKGVFDGGSKS